LEVLIHERTEETIRWYHDDMDALGALRPTHEPRATAYIPQMIAMIETLIAGGHAYAANGHALFRVRSYKDYGALSGRSVDDMIAGARVEVAPFNEDPMDFVLWKPSSGDEPGWDSPWGRGRPGWHIECSAMSHELLGASFDIHGGGLDLQFPHHENEIAQSCCAHPDSGFANVWMHNEMLQVEGKKMSKSLGNFFTVRDLLDQGYPGEVIRMVYLGTHYSKPMDWTKEKAEQAEATLRKWAALVDERSGVTGNEYSAEMDQVIVSALADDLNTHAALQRMHELYRVARESSYEGLTALRALYHSAKGLLGIDLVSVHERLRPKTIEDAIADLELTSAYWRASFREAIDGLVMRRMAAKANKDFALSDHIRDGLSAAGVVLTDTKDGPVWTIGTSFDPSKLEALK
jgi:cysteinyl-tRNA synthetase